MCLFSQLRKAGTFLLGILKTYPGSPNLSLLTLMTNGRVETLCTPIKTWYFPIGVVMVPSQHHSHQVSYRYVSASENIRPTFGPWMWTSHSVISSRPVHLQ